MTGTAVSPPIVQGPFACFRSAQMTSHRQRASRLRWPHRAGGLLLVLVLVLFSLAGPAAWAEPAAHDGTRLSVVVVPPPAGPGARANDWTIYLDGYLDSGSAARVAGELARHRIPAAIVYFNSPGGSLLEAMTIGRLLRDHGFDTDVGRRTSDPLRPYGGVCYSACPFAHAGGVRRGLAAGSLLGVHRAENRVPLLDESAFERRVRDDAMAYLENMGVSPQLYALMVRVPPGKIRVLSLEEAVHLALVNSPAAAD